MGVRDGYAGLIAGSINLLKSRDVGGIIQRGGTILGSARCPEFRTSAGQQSALKQLKEKDIDGLIVIGGNGSQTGNYALSQLGFPTVGIASTIDNDLYGSEICIGVDTALNIALEAIDRLKTTASSHKRAFLIEVMGRDCGYLALMAGLAGGAEFITLPEIETDSEELASTLLHSYEIGKRHAIVVVAEGAKYNAENLIAYFSEHHERLGFEVRATILGHTQRGGIPSAFDRILASRLGEAAVDCLERNEVGVLVGLIDGDIKTTPLSEVVANKKQLDPKLISLANTLY
jgi:6-phosphofructokinase 1